ncbi:sugar phosphate isomerase/epimerase [Arthrobacter sp. GMC3]|uniref:sugar phosphate isomerase/epimerase family protein n=1 Tax=Arthrobacter sp. GMC3 TaxID=2058894 RepID=UPI000CE49218|nr:sugar phosphate isomerase/epimerase [Arthrobacter sp. GMC3]
MRPAAVQLWSVHSAARKDLDRVLAELAGQGFLAVETIDLYGRTPVKFRQSLDRAGLDVCSAHAPFPTGQTGEATLETYSELGVDTLAWSLEEEEFKDRESLLRGLERVNDAAERAAAHGMRIAYHNHYYEFAEATGSDAGRTWYEVLQEESDPRVLMQLDLYWVGVAGKDMVKVATSLGDRLVSVHAKDGPGHGLSDVMVPIGTGAVDVRPALAAVNPEWTIIELDRVEGNMIEALGASYRTLKEARLVYGKEEV